jgi:transposase
MAMRREGAVQDDLVVTWAEMPRSPGHAFYGRLQALLSEAGFDAFVEATCKPYYAARMGAPSLPPGRYFRMHMVGYFEGIDSERAWMAVCGFGFAARFPAAGAPGQGTRPFLAVEDPQPAAARGA